MWLRAILGLLTSAIFATGVVLVVAVTYVDADDLPAPVATLAVDAEEDAEARAEPAAEDLAEEGGDEPNVYAQASQALTALPIDEHEELTAALSAVLADPGLDGAQIGVAVVDPDGRVVFDHDADRLMIPASTQKLVTAAAALEAFGDAHRLTTEALADGTLADGDLHGDLFVVGGGDPVLADGRFSRWAPERPRTRLEELADDIAASGLRRIHGRVVGDATVFPWQPQAPGWRSSYLADGDTPRISGLTVNGGRRSDGDGIHGAMSVSPAKNTARALTRLLQERGIEVAGGTDVGQAPASARPVASVESRPLRDLLRFSVQRSDNQIADTLWRLAGTVDGNGTWEAGSQAARDTLERAGVDTEGMRLVDGSGLSRDNRISPLQLAQLDMAMAARHGNRWDDLMAVAAADTGTLRNRLHDTTAAGALRGKTGTLEDVRTFAGSVHGPGGRWHLAVLGNGLHRSQTAFMAEAIDEVAKILARQARGCDLAGC